MRPKLVYIYYKFSPGTLALSSLTHFLLFSDDASYCSLLLYYEHCTTLPLTVFTQRNFVADFLQAKTNFVTQIGRFAFFRPPLGD